MISDRAWSAARSILVEHLLDFVRLARLRKGQLQQYTGLLRTQIIGCDEPRLLPVIILDDPPGSHSGAPHDHDAGRVVDLLECLSRVLGVTGSGSGNDQSVGAR